MTRARTELAIAVATALVLAALLATWHGQRSADATGASVADSMFTSDAAGLAPDANAAFIVQDTTVLTGPLPGMMHEPPAPELESTQLESDRAYIAEAFPALSTWDVARLKPLLATDALDASTDADLEQVMTTLGARLGTLQHFDEPQPVEGTETIEYASASTELQPYRFTAWYEAGAAEVNLVLERKPEHSAVYSFDIHIPD